MKDWQLWLYPTKQWAACRDAYARSKGLLCELCLLEGKTTAGEIVHHKIHVNASNVDDPNITLNWDNLQLLCREHHAQVHKRVPTRYKIDEMGRVIII